MSREKSPIVIKHTDFLQYGCAYCGDTSCKGYSFLSFSNRCFSWQCVSCNKCFFVVEKSVGEIDFNKFQKLELTSNHPFNPTKQLDNLMSCVNMDCVGNKENSNEQPKNSLIINLTPEEDQVFYIQKGAN